MKHTLPNAANRYGAPMGRSNTVTEPDLTARFYLHALKWVDGDYDEGGAYWGYVRGTRIYRAYAEGFEEVQEVFIRAKSRKEAKEAVLRRFPNAKFFN